MPTGFGAHSEVGKLRKVIVHRPGLEMRRLTPSNCQELLFDDVIWTRKARQEHDAFVDLMRDEFGIQVWRVHELLQDVVADPEGRAYILNRKLIANEGAHSHFHACRNRVMKPKERGENWPIGRSFSNARL
ncbi:MAG: hypothetical protein GY759_10895 [Chloroflexi bacterium]|nr:hypothetical protein [Chloroflexota bacterium]